MHPLKGRLLDSMDDCCEAHTSKERHLSTDELYPLKIVEARMNESVEIDFKLEATEFISRVTKEGT